MKKGISSVIASVLIILLAIASVSIIWSVIIPLLQQKSEINLKPSLLILPSPDYTFYDKSKNLLSLQLKRQPDSEDFNKIKFIFYKQGNSESKIIKNIPNKGESKTYYFNLTYFEEPSEALVIPLQNTNELTPSQKPKIPESTISNSDIAQEIIPLYENTPAFESIWLENNLLNNIWDKKYGSTTKLILDETNQYALKGTHNTAHTVRQSLEKDVDNWQSWGGTIYINPKDLVFKNSNLVFLAGYPGKTSSEDGWARNFALQIGRKDGKTFICAAAYGFNAASCSRHPYTSIDIPDADYTSLEDLLDKWIKIDWLLSKEYKVYFRVENSEWKKINTPQKDESDNFKPFNRIMAGWISSFNEGSILVKNITIYNETGMKKWEKELARFS